MPKIAWSRAKAAPVLALGIVSLRFAKNKQNNRAAVQDLVLATGNLSVEATARGLSVHQMTGRFFSNPVSPVKKCAVQA
jgi:hypothetical protein